MFARSNVATFLILVKTPCKLNKSTEHLFYNPGQHATRTNQCKFSHGTIIRRSSPNYHLPVSIPNTAAYNMSSSQVLKTQTRHVTTPANMMAMLWNVTVSTRGWSARRPATIRKTVFVAPMTDRSRLVRWGDSRSDSDLAGMYTNGV